MNRSNASADPRAIPKGSVLLHIGPPKTGTSALQGACHAQRDLLARAGVHYAGPGVQPSTAAFAVTRREHPSTGRPPSMRHWRSLVKEVTSHRSETVLISSEFFAGASAEQAREVIAALGGERVHVVVTLRPLGKILASRWQQNVQEGARVGYGEWLTDVLKAPESTHAKRFWSRQRHDALVARWSVAGSPERTHVVVIDDRDHDGILRTFEQLLGIPTETLAGHRDTPNRSMTLQEIEVVRAFNEQFHEAGLAPSLRYQLMSRGAATHLKRRAPLKDEPRITTPPWALDEANCVAQEMIESIYALGVKVYGDTSLLLTDRGAQQEGGLESETRISVSPEIAARAAIGVLFASGATRGYESGSNVPAWGEPYDLQRATTLQLLTVAAQRVITNLARRFRRLIR